MSINEILFGYKTKSILKIMKKGNLEELNSFIKNGGNVFVKISILRIYYLNIVKRVVFNYLDEHI